MAIERVVRCDGLGCGCVISPDTGFAILGNIHKVGKPTNDRHFECVGGGLVGNNLNGDDMVTKVVYYCESCMIKILGFNRLNPYPEVLLREGNLVGSL